MRMIILILCFLILATSARAVSIEIELTPDNMKKFGFEIDVLDNDRFVIFKVYWNRILQIPINGDTVIALNSGVEAMLQIGNRDSLIARSSIGFGRVKEKPFFYFEAAKKYLERARFGVTIRGERTADSFWFNLGRLYKESEIIRNDPPQRSLPVPGYE